MFARGRGGQAGPVEVRLEISGGRPVTGRVQVAEGEPVPFTGWLALLAVLERLVDGSQAAAGGVGGQLGAGGQAQLAQGAGDVGVHGVAGDEQPGGDVAVGPPLGDQPDHP